MIKRLLVNCHVLCLFGSSMHCRKAFCDQNFQGKYRYVSFEDDQVRELFYQDPGFFFREYSSYIMFDHCHLVTSFLEKLCYFVPSDSMYYGRFIICANYARYFDDAVRLGRGTLMSVHPLVDEPLENNDDQISLQDKQYERVYERVIRDMMAITNIHANRHIHRLVEMIPQFVGKPMNFSLIARDLAVSVPSVIRWMDFLIDLQVIFYVRPCPSLRRGRVVKSPKLFFHDSGFLHFLQTRSGLDSIERDMFVNTLVSDLQKRLQRMGLSQSLHYHKNSNGMHIDIIWEKKGQRFFINFDHEEKYNLKHVKSIEKVKCDKDVGFVVYRGENVKITSNIYAICDKDFIIA